MYNDIPQLWRDVLAAVQREFPSAVIAGGALRDLWHDKTPKDVDIFIPLTDAELIDPNAGKQFLIDSDFEPFWDDLHTKIRRVHSYAEQEIHQGSEYMEEATPAEPQRKLHAIYTLTIANVKFECIFVSAVDAPVHHNFDINIVQAAYDGKTVDYTAAFLDGVETKTIRVMNENRKDRQAKRLARITEKYPEYSVAH